MLLDPLKEQFHLPPRLIDQDDSKCRQGEVVSQKLETLPGFDVEIAHAPQLVRVGLTLTGTYSRSFSLTATGTFATPWSAINMAR